MYNSLKLNSFNLLSGIRRIDCFISIFKILIIVYVCEENIPIGYGSRNLVILCAPIIKILSIPFNQGT